MDRIDLCTRTKCCGILAALVGSGKEIIDDTEHRDQVVNTLAYLKSAQQAVRLVQTWVDADTPERQVLLEEEEKEEADVAVIKELIDEANLLHDLLLDHGERLRRADFGHRVASIQEAIVQLQKRMEPTNECSQASDGKVHVGAVKIISRVFDWYYKYHRGEGDNVASMEVLVNALQAIWDWLNIVKDWDDQDDLPLREEPDDVVRELWKCFMDVRAMASSGGESPESILRDMHQKIRPLARHLNMYDDVPEEESEADSAFCPPSSRATWCPSGLSSLPSIWTAASRWLGERVSAVLSEQAQEMQDLMHRHTMLHQAALDGDVKRVRALLEASCQDLNAPDYIGDTPLMQASWNGHMGVVELLLSRKETDLEVDDSLGRTALIQASTKGHLEIVKLLLEKGAALNKAAHDGRTALMEASRQGHLEVVKLLAQEAGLDLDAQDSLGRSALFLAAMDGQMEVVKVLLEKGADPSKRSKDGRTARMEAAEQGHLEIAKLIEIAEKEVLLQVCKNARESLLELMRRVSDLLCKEMFLEDAILMIAKRTTTANKDSIGWSICKCNKASRKLSERLDQHPETSSLFEVFQMRMERMERMERLERMVRKQDEVTNSRGDSDNKGRSVFEFVKLEEGSAAKTSPISSNFEDSDGLAAGVFNEEAIMADGASVATVTTSLRDGDVGVQCGQGSVSSQINLSIIHEMGVLGGRRDDSFRCRHQACDPLLSLENYCGLLSLENYRGYEGYLLQDACTDFRGDEEVVLAAIPAFRNNVIALEDVKPQLQMKASLDEQQSNFEGTTATPEAAESDADEDLETVRQRMNELIDDFIAEKRALGESGAQAMQASWNGHSEALESPLTEGSLPENSAFAGQDTITEAPSDKALEDQEVRVNETSNNGKTILIETVACYPGQLEGSLDLQQRNVKAPDGRTALVEAFFVAPLLLEAFIKARSAEFKLLFVMVFFVISASNAIVRGGGNRGCSVRFETLAGRGLRLI